MACVLDPRFRKPKFLSGEEIELVMVELQSRIESLTTTESLEDSPPEKRARVDSEEEDKQSALDYLLGSNSTEINTVIDVEVEIEQ